MVIQLYLYMYCVQLLSKNKRMPIVWYFWNLTKKKKSSDNEKQKKNFTFIFDEKNFATVLNQTQEDWKVLLGSHRCLIDIHGWIQV